MSRTRPLVYVAGPYSKPDPCMNTHHAIWVAEQIIKMTNGEVSPVVPHLTHFWHTMEPHPYEFWLSYDLDLLARCDLVLRCHGASSGADAEVVKAMEWGIPVVFDVESVVEWNEGRKPKPKPLGPMNTDPYGEAEIGAWK